MNVRELGHALRDRKFSCVELIAQTFESIRAGDGALNSFITLTEEQALAEAAERDTELSRGIDRGPFHGIPIAHKDLFYTKGVRTTGGSLIFADFVPEFDATVVRRFRAAGAISVGKTNLHELAYGITSNNPHYGAVLNPVDTARIPGGSSGGSGAAIAAGWISLATGTDTGGSIRIPASYCGITGLKPTYGRVSRHGVLPLGYTLDHVGPMGSCVEDCALAMDVMAGFDALDGASSDLPCPDFNLPALADLHGVRLGVPQSGFFDDLDPEVEGSVRRALELMENAGAVVAEVATPELGALNRNALTTLLSEAASLYAGQTDETRFGRNFWKLMEVGRAVPAHEYVAAQRARLAYRRLFDALWQSVDVLVTPATPITAPLLGAETVTIAGKQEDVRPASTRLVRSLNYLGEPALSMPCGKTAGGLPVGLQLIAPRFAEPRLLQIARTLETLLP